MGKVKIVKNLQIFFQILQISIFENRSFWKYFQDGDPLAVVDSKCKVFGTTGLRVVDSSIMPSVASGIFLFSESPRFSFVKKLWQKMLCKQNCCKFCEQI